MQEERTSNTKIYGGISSYVLVVPPESRQRGCSSGIRGRRRRRRRTGGQRRRAAEREEQGLRPHGFFDSEDVFFVNIFSKLFLLFSFSSSALLLLSLPLRHMLRRPLTRVEISSDDKELVRIERDRGRERGREKIYDKSRHFAA